MDQQGKVKFYQTQTFLVLVAIVLASALLTTSVVESVDSLFGAAPENVLGVEDAIALASASTEADGADARSADPAIHLTLSVEDDKATIHAEIADAPKGVAYILQWQNDLSGTYENVPGETGDSITFDANAANMNCNWRVELTPVDEVYYR